jgi:hypothetical protein
MFGVYPFATTPLGDLLRRLLTRKKKEYIVYLQKKNYVLCLSQRRFEILDNKKKFILIPED